MVGALGEYAVELEELSANPLHRIKWKPPKTTETVDPRIVVNPRQAQELLTVVTYVGRRGVVGGSGASFTCMYYAALRPAEAIALRREDCNLPKTGWGCLIDVSARGQHPVDGHQRRPRGTRTQAPRTG